MSSLLCGDLHLLLLPPQVVVQLVVLVDVEFVVFRRHRVHQHAHIQLFDVMIEYVNL